MMNIEKIVDEIIGGRRLTREDDLSFFLDCDLEVLAFGANRIREELCGRHIDLCTIINGRAGSCSEDCKFCAQSAHYQTGCEKHGFVETSDVLEDCKSKEQAGVNAYSIVTAGRSVEGSDLDHLIEMYAVLHKECNICLCASLGFVAKEAFERLKEAGVTRYHANIETSRNYFGNVCTTHTYEDKLAEIRMAKEAGLMVCSGGIIGMGETWEDRIEMALALSELGIMSIPLNAFIPIKGTPFENLERITQDDIIRSVAIFRFVNPEAFIRMAAGRNYFEDGGKRLFESGVNATITGDMLTTTGNDMRSDMKLLDEMGFCW